MKTYIYAGDLYCEACGTTIRAELARQGRAPAHPEDEYSYDSDDYPKGPHDADEKADAPQHCASRGYCPEAHVFPSGFKAGKFLENPLTAEGRKYVREAHLSRPHSEVAAMWMDHYNLHRD